MILNLSQNLYSPSALFLGFTRKNAQNHVVRRELMWNG